MKKYLHTIAKVLFSLILILPVVGVTGLLGEPTRELYNTDQAYGFIQMLADIKYISYMMAVVHVLALIALWTKREPLAALLELPITLNVVAFHLVIDGGLLTGGAILANLMLVFNMYLLFIHRGVITSLAVQK
ncbi:hypothetical protein KBB12_03990 [Candidatus Woesebacteria bacterium]|nr:hypothetical protein [Candidatus Woesebacteria bacterium]